MQNRLAQIEGIIPLKQTLEQNYYSYIFKYDARYFQGVAKAVFMEALVAEGIPLFSSPSHQFPAYRSGSFSPRDKDYDGVYCPVAEEAFQEEAIGFQATWMLFGRSGGHGRHCGGDPEDPGKYRRVNEAGWTRGVSPREGKWEP